jgi:hypothetical protein
VSHNREIIIDAISPALRDPEVREHFTPQQATKTDQILNGTQPCSDHDFRYLIRRLERAYCQDD